MRPLTLFVLVVGVACLVFANEDDPVAEETPAEAEEGHQTAANSTVVQHEAEHDAETEAEPTPEHGASPETANKGDDNGAHLMTSSLLAVFSAVALHAVLV